MDNAQQGNEMAEKKLEWIKAQIAAGRTVYLSTCLRVTKITAKHIGQIRVRGNALEIQHGRRWIDYSHTKISAA